MRPFQLDPNFKPLFNTPNHPGYPSAHSCLSGSAAEILGYLFPRDAQALNALSSAAGDSRVWAGIHFPSDVTAGLALGPRGRSKGHRACPERWLTNTDSIFKIRKGMEIDRRR